MLSFFRKYQRPLLIVFSCVLISSFCFFGIAPQGYGGAPRPADQVIGKGIDGSPLKRSEIEHLVRLFGPCGFNDGFLEKDFFASKLAKMVMDTYFEECEGELKDKFIKFQKFQPYVHPHLPFISVERLWEQVMPEQKQRFEAFKKSSCNVEGVHLLMDLYLGEMQLPPQLMKQFLMSSEKQFPSVPQDPQLRGADLSLFKCKSVEELLGTSFCNKVAEVIHNVAIMAKQKGYTVSYEEARVELMQNAAQFFSRGREAKEIPQLIKEQVARLGMEERELVKAWQKVLLFRRLFNDYGASVLVDRLPIQQFEEFALAGSQVDRYTMPVKIGNLSELMKLQFYIDAVTSERKTMGPLDLPQTFLKPELIAFDELLYKKYRLKVAKIDKREVASKISLSETWNFERGHFKMIQEVFPEVGTASLDQDPDDVLDGLPFDLRLKVDEFARMRLVSCCSTRMQEALEEVEGEEKEYVLSKKGPWPFEGITDREGFLALLDHKHDLNHYSQDGIHYYRLQVVEGGGDLQVFTFKEASELGVLDALVDAYLEKEYPEVRVKNPTLFQNLEGGWLSYKEVKPFVGQLVYGDLLKALPGKTPEEKCQMRLKVPMEKALDHLKKGHRHLVNHEGKEPSSHLADQWLLSVSEVAMRKGTLGSFSSSLLTLKPGAWSEVSVGEDGEASVCQVKKLLSDEGNYSQVVLKYQAGLSQDAKCFLMKEILDKLKVR